MFSLSLPRMTSCISKYMQHRHGISLSSVSNFSRP
jgi:hypothetical protein